MWLIVLLTNQVSFNCVRCVRIYWKQPLLPGGIDMLAGTIFQTVIVVLGALLSAGGALLYFQHVHLERPAIGVFNARDIVIIIFFVLTLPFLYILLPSGVLIA